jgi:hypothetical protein
LDTNVSEVARVSFLHAKNCQQNKRKVVIKHDINQYKPSVFGFQYIPVFKNLRQTQLFEKERMDEKIMKMGCWPTHRQCFTSHLAISRIDGRSPQLDDLTGVLLHWDSPI